MSFWNAVFSARDANSMADKYAWLRQEVLEAGAPAPSGALREAARRWPGSLREWQRVHPERYRARERWAQEGGIAPERAHSAWAAEGRVAVCLWSELHQRTAEVLAWRAAAPTQRHDWAAFLRDLTRSDPERGAAWPALAVLQGVCPRGVGTRAAAAGLAVRVGWAPARLRACLLDLPE